MFELGPEHLSFIGVDSGRIVEPGVFDGRVRGLQRNFDWK
jgi:hypothetical protein